MRRRAGLDRAVVVEAAAKLADKDGLAQLSLSRLATQLGVRTPSLYNHVDGLPGLLREMALLGGRELGRRLGRAAIGRSGDDAIIEMAHAYRAFAQERPGLYAAVQHAPDPEDQEAQEVANSVVGIVLTVLAGYNLAGDDAIHATRAFRSAMHGFVTLESIGGFGIPLDLDESFDRMILMLLAGFRR